MNHLLRSTGFALLLAAAPAFGQVDLTGNWAPITQEDQPERGPGPELVDFGGLPINAEARQWALSWDPDRLTLPEHQCQVHVVSYIHRGPHQMRIWEERDPQTQDVVALRIYISTYEQNRTIWMDGRAHPPEYAAHTWMGFSTGRWEGNLLTVTTTHIKQGWTRRNGLPVSDQATLTEHFIRHGSQITQVSVTTDPVYLAEPLVKTQNYNLNLNPVANWLWPCEYVDEAPGRAEGTVPSYLPGENPFLTEYAAHWGIPLEGVLGGPETMYPEYRLKLKTLPIPAKK
jgi:hypothetical protein